MAASLSRFAPLAAATLLAHPAAGQPGLLGPPGVPAATTWTHHLAFPNCDGVRSVAFAPDSKTLYGHIHSPTIDLWKPIVHAWPEVLGGLAILLTLILIALALRAARRPQTPGAPCCRRCGYDVSSQVSATQSRRGRRIYQPAPGALCPECGSDLARRRPIRGRSLRRRIAPLSALWILAAGGYGMMHVAELPRTGRAQDWLDLSSSWLADLVTRRKLDRLAPLIKRTDRILEIDLATGATRRTVATRGTTSHTRLAVSPDGRSLFLVGVGGGRVDRISTRTGRRQASLGTPGNMIIDVQADSVVGFSPDGRTAYVQWLNRDEACCGVTGWNLDTGRSSTLVSTPTYVRTTPGGSPWPIGRHFLHRPGGQTPRFISWPGFMEAFPTKKFIYRLHDDFPGLFRALEPKPTPGVNGCSILSPDGATLFYLSQYGAELVGLDLESGQVIGRLPLGMGGHETPGGQPGRPHPGNPGPRRDSHSRYRRQAMGRDAHPSAEVYGPRPTVSPDGRWVAAVSQKTIGSDGKALPPGTRGAAFKHEVTLWDIGALTSSGAAPAPAAPPP